MWLSASAGRLLLTSDTSAAPAGKLGVGLTLLHRVHPAVLTVPSPNQYGRDVNVLKHASDVTLGGRLGIGNRLELTLLLPAGLYQRGAGIKGVTDQSAPGIAQTTVHDPRVGFGYSFVPPSRAIGAKLRFEAKLPLGNREALSGEPSVVASPSVALSASRGGFFAGAERDGSLAADPHSEERGRTPQPRAQLGARLRRPTSLFGVRVGSQASISLGAGYELAGPRLALAGELYLLPSLIDSGAARYLPSEWLVSVRWAPRRLAPISLGLGGGGGLPLSGEAGGSSLAFGVPSFRGLVFVRAAASTEEPR
jgi:hypothetical protein